MRLSSHGLLLVPSALFAVFLAGFAGCEGSVTLVDGIPAMDAAPATDAGVEDAAVDDAAQDAAPDEPGDDAGGSNDVDCGVADADDDTRPADICATD